ncbi:MAG TPA: hypothetical protein VJW51_01295 [Candidatus Acidoferrales bacterium]|nr:hypothetical protein [Candidatus Acidoferrales bacterium]
MNHDFSKGRRMGTAKPLILLGILLLVLAGCNRQRDEKEAISASIRQHVTSMSGLRMDAMVLELSQVTLNGNHAEAMAEFRPKQGPAGTSLQVRYQLEKREGAWVVLSGQPVGGQMSHPAGGQMPPGQTVSPDTQPQGQAALPAGHPPLTPPNQTPNQTPATKPHP